MPIDHFSASQLKKFIRCPRKWALKYVHGLDDGGGEALWAGIVFHQLAESANTPVPQGIGKTELRRIAEGDLLIHEDVRLFDLDHDVEPSAKRQQKAAQLVLKGWENGVIGPGLRDGHFDSNILVEEPLSGLTIEGVEVEGYIDLAIVGPKLEVWDYKTTSSWRWAKSQRELQQNLQLILYACDLLGLFPQYKQVEIGQHQFNKKTQTMRTVSTTMSAEAIEEAVDSLAPYAREMKRIAEEADLERTRPNHNACGDYGGCPFLDECHAVDYVGEQSDDKGLGLTSSAGNLQIDSNETEQENDMGFLDNLKEAKKAKQDDDTQTPDEQTVGDDLGAEEAPAPTVQVLGTPFEYETDAMRDKLERLDTALRDANLTEIDASLLSDMTLQRYTVEGLVDLVREELADGADTVDEADIGEEATTAEGVTPPEAPEAPEAKSLSEKTLADWNIEQVKGIGGGTADKIYDSLPEGKQTPLSEFADLDHSELPKVGPKTAGRIAKELADVLGFHNDLPDDSPGASADEAMTEVERAFERWRSIYEGETEPHAKFDLSEFDLDAEGRAEVDRRIEDYSRGVADRHKTDEQSADGQAQPDEHDGAYASSVLLVDCAPSKFNGREVVPLIDLLGPLMTEVADDLGVAHYSLPDYRAGEKQLAGKVLRDIDQFKGKVIVADSVRDYAKSVLEALERHMDVVVKG